MAAVLEQAEDRPLRLHLDILPRFLVERKLLHPSVIVDGKVRVEDLTRRNRNFRVTVRPEGGLMIKQASNPSTEFIDSLRVEALMYKTISEDETLQPLRWFTPRIRLWDEKASILITDLVHPSTTYYRYHMNQGAIQFPVEAAETAGAFLGLMHTLCGRAAAEGKLDFLNSSARKYPLVYYPRSNFGMGGNDMVTGVAQILHVIRARGGYEERIERVRDSWRRDALVHGDIRWDNILLTSGAAPADHMNARLIDWETACHGDRRFDVSAYLGEYMRFFLTNMRGAVPRDLAQMPDAAWEFLPRMHESVRAFWASYVSACGFTREERLDLYDRVVEHVPITLIQITLELCQSVQDAPPVAFLAEQLADRAMREPEACMAQWFGLSREAA